LLQRQHALVAPGAEPAANLDIQLLVEAPAAGGPCILPRHHPPNSTRARMPASARRDPGARGRPMDDMMRKDLPIIMW
jgi:hypothetical protein